MSSVTMGDVTMRAITQVGYGGPDVLRLAEVPRPTPGPGRVLVRVRAAGVDRGTWHLMAGRPYAVRAVLGLRRPRNTATGLDVAGTVAALGPGVSGFAVGDAVFGTAHGSFAEYVVARADRIAPKPDRLGFEEAAVVAVSGLTALQGLREAGRVRAGQRVLVTGASGGVGTYAVQLAKAFGAEVTGLCGPAKADLVRSLGADHVVDYTCEDVTAGGRRFDLVLDLAGSTPVARLRRVLEPRGTLVVAGGEDDGDWLGLGRQFRALVRSPFTRQRLTMLLSRQGRAGLDDLAGLIEAGSVTPVVGSVFPLERVPEALTLLTDGGARGKIAITV
ncbi:NAD(P)-dependent alcohol dehydrogenase [Streptomyces sp. RerS4]|uniref:NAD(P)-dependent alcohol dehydrogenase n=1 Tax=Streptomyces sp. RerS4 TaxID=2942449 RepID=UPI00201C846F|nr:NAD(P)-dependent alcohol dehydrogenase [Streptomyces sp. RerS4]UQX04473.1 NAD(P)-dependent alcohol dehydrogenase [Streptomyces sp. RerS4]